MPKNRSNSLALTAIVLLLVASFSSCRREPAVDAGTETATWISGEQREPVAIAETGKTVVVTISEQSIGIPTLFPGPMVFMITNAGFQPIGFRIQGGEDVDLSLGVPIEPGATATLEADLGSGTYLISAPLDNVSGTGATLEVTVEEP